MKVMCTPTHFLGQFPVTQHFPFGDVPLITFADPDLPLPPKPAWVKDRLHVHCHDLGEAIPGFRPPDAGNAKAILDFYERHKEAGNLLVSCTAGAGRSPAVIAALATLNRAPAEADRVFRQGTYNRLLYKLIVEAGGGTVPPEPLVSLVVRLKYPPDRIAALIMSMERQRWKNWEMIVVTDGPLTPWYEHPASRWLIDGRVQVVQTAESKGRWGHPHRQLGIDRALQDADFIGLSNDDNYYVPGYLDQMVYALESQQADLVLCDYLSHYHGWQVVRTKPEPFHCDLGCWLARAALVKATPWQGAEFTSDGDYVERLAKAAQKVVKVDRPLFCHN